MTQTFVGEIVDERDDETASPLPLPSTDIERDRARALWEYEEGIIGFHRFRAWIDRLSYQEGVRSEIAASLAEAPDAVADEPIARDRHGLERTSTTLELHLRPVPRRSRQPIGAGRGRGL